MPVVAIGALELGADVLAMCAVLILLAALLIQRVVAEVVHHLPQFWPITALNSVVDWIGSAISSLAGWLWDHCNPIHALLEWGSWIWQHVLLPIPTAIGSAVAAIQRVITYTIPGAIHNVMSWANSLIYGVANQVIAWVSGWINTLASWIDAAKALAISLYNQAVALSYQLVNWMVQYVEGRIAATIAYLTVVVGTAVRGLEADLDALRRWLLAQLGAAVGVLTADLLALRNWLLQTLLPSLLAIGATVAALAIDWGNWRARCGDPMCNGFSDLLNIVTGLNAVLDAELILSLFNDIRNDPGGVSQEISEAVSEPIQFMLNALGIERQAS